MFFVSGVVLILCAKLKPKCDICFARRSLGKGGE
jgi:hypothetical protein